LVEATLVEATLVEVDPGEVDLVEVDPGEVDLVEVDPVEVDLEVVPGHPPVSELLEMNLALEVELEVDLATMKLEVDSAVDLD